MEDFKVKLKSTSGGNLTEIMSIGTVSKEFGDTVIEFKEDSKSSHNTKIVVGKEIVSIIRQGEVGGILTFEEGKQMISLIQTEYGEYPLQFLVHKITRDIKDDEISLFLDYETLPEDESGKFKIELNCKRLN